MLSSVPNKDGRASIKNRFNPIRNLMFIGAITIKYVASKVRLVKTGWRKSNTRNGIPQRMPVNSIYCWYMRLWKMHLTHNTNIWTKVKYSLVSPLLLPPISKRSGPKPWARLLVFVWGRPIHHFQSPSSGHAFHEEEHLSFLWRGVPSVRREKQRKRLPWGGTNTSPLLLSFCLPHPSPAFKPFLCEVGP